MPLDLSPDIHDRPFRQWIEGSGLSLEANTASTPTEGVFYVLQAGVVRFSSEDLAEAREVFHSLCIDHWEELLTSPNRQERLDGARGLFRHDASHARALEVLSADGNDQDRHRITQARQRARYEERRKQLADAPTDQVTG
jgi:hypothetical protein